MKPILCPDCGHSINEHGKACSHHDTINPATWSYCKCKQSAESIASHAIQAAVSEAVEVIKPFAHPDLYKIMSNNIPEGVESIVFVRNEAVLRINDFLSAAAYLAAHQDTTPQEAKECSCDVKPEDERYLDIDKNCPVHGSEATPQDVRTVAERNLDQWQSESYQTRESDRP